MAISEEVIVRISIGKAAKAGEDVERIGQRGTKAFSGMSSAVATMTKALLSMFAVIVAFNVLIHIPQRIAGAFKDLAFASIEAADAMERQILSTAGLLASFSRFGPTAGESFAGAVVQSEKLLIQFEQLAAESVATAEDIQLAFQTVVSRGGLQFVKTLDEAVTLSKFLTDTIIGLTGGLNKERQLVSETSALFEGQARAGALLAKIIKAQVGDLQTWLEIQKAQGTLTESLMEMFKGIPEAASALGDTVEGIIASIMGSIRVLNRMFAQSGALVIVIAQLKEWRTLLQGVTKELLEMDDATQEISRNTRGILESFAKFQVSVVNVVEGLRVALFRLTGAEDSLGIIETIADSILAVTVVLRVFLESISGEVLDRAVTKAALMFLAFQGIAIAMYAITPAGRIGRGLVEMLSKTALLLAPLTAAATVIKSIQKDLSEEMFVATLTASLEVEQSIQSIVERLKELGRTASDLGVLVTQIAQMTEQQEKAMIAIVRQMEQALGASNKWLLIMLQSRHAIEDAVEMFGDIPRALEEAAGAIMKQRNAQLENLAAAKLVQLVGQTIKAQEGDMAELLFTQSSTRHDIRVALIGEGALLTRILTTVANIHRFEREILQARIQQRSNQAIGGLQRDLEVILGTENSIAAIEAEHNLKALQLVETLKGETIWLGVALGLLRQITDEKIKQSNVKGARDVAALRLTESRRAAQDVADTLNRLAQSGEGGLPFAANLQLLNIQLRKTGVEIDLNNRELENLAALSKTTTGPALKGITDDMRQLERENINWNNILLETQNRVIAAFGTLPNAEKLMQSAIMRMILFKDIVTGLKEALQAVGLTIAQVFADIVSNSNDGVNAFRKLIGSMINAIAVLIISLGTALFALGILNFNPAMAATGLAMIAAGGALLGAARLLSQGKSSDAATGGSAATQGGTQTIVLQSSNQQKLNDTLENLDGSINSLDSSISGLEGVQPGEIVARGMDDSRAQRATVAGLSRAVASSRRQRQLLAEPLIEQG